jgi:GNAT superfamily N-acetyltransferase
LIELCAEHAAYEGASYDPQGKVESLTRALFAPIHACTPGLSSSVVAWWDMRRRLRSFPAFDAACFLHMDCLYLREETRGLGLGRQLVMEIASLAYRLGCVNVQWQTPVWNERAIRFYQRLGGEGKEKVRFVFGGEAKDPFLPSERETPNVTMVLTDPGDQKLSS